MGTENELCVIKQKVEEGVLKFNEYIQLTVYTAKECGEALLKAKDIVGHGNYMKWLKENFPEDDYQTLNVFKLVAENWDGDAVQEAIEEGKKLNSRDALRRFFKALKKARKEEETLNKIDNTSKSDSGKSKGKPTIDASIDSSLEKLIKRDLQSLPTDKKKLVADHWKDWIMPIIRECLEKNSKFLTRFKSNENISRTVIV